MNSARKLIVAGVALATALFGMANTASAQPPTGSFASVASAGPSCPNGFGLIGVSIPPTSYTSPLYGYYLPTKVTTPALCAYSTGRYWYTISQPTGQPGPKCEPSIVVEKGYVSQPQFKLGHRATSITVYCDVHTLIPDRGNVWLFRVKVKVKVRHKCQAGGFCRPILTDTMWGTTCVKSPTECWPWAKGYR